MKEQEYTVSEDNIKIQVEFVTRTMVESMVDSLTKERKRQGLTQKNIADITGMQASNIARIESKKHETTFDVLFRYAKALGKTFRIDLVDEDKSKHMWLNDVLG